jgi:hypothetical protein
MTTPQDLLPNLQERLTALGYPPGTCLYRVTIDDLLTVLAPCLAKTPVSLSDADLEAMLDQVTSYLNGEGMPWHTVVSLGIQDGWPEHLTHPEETR